MKPKARSLKELEARIRKNLKINSKDRGRLRLFTSEDYRNGYLLGLRSVLRAITGKLE